MEKYKNNEFSFSGSNAALFFANNFEKFSIVVCVILFICGFLLNNSNFYGLFALIFFLILLTFAFIKVANKFVHKIVIDFNSQKIELHMFRSNEAILRSFAALKKIRVNGYIIFIFDNKKVFYNDLRNLELFECLNKVRKIEWGGLCSIWGPDKSIIDRISS